jgi:hypothetical protein
VFTICPATLPAQFYEWSVPTNISKFGLVLATALVEGMCGELLQSCLACMETFYTTLDIVESHTFACNQDGIVFAPFGQIHADQGFVQITSLSQKLINIIELQDQS